MSNRQVYQTVGSLRPGRSVFDLTYSKLLTCDMGQLIPIQIDEVVPGDIFEMGVQAVVRFQPLVAPILHEINLYTHTFFYPYRILWENAGTDNWETFITGGVDGDQAPTIPTWTPTTYNEGSLWDYCGFPIDIDPELTRPLDFPRRAYNRCINEYYLDENLDTPLLLTNEDIQYRRWEKDYFTSSLPWQQKGTAVALPLSGNVPVTGIGKQNQTYPNVNQQVYETEGTGLITYADSAMINNADVSYQWNIEEDPTNAGFPNIRADLSLGTSVDISDLRLAFQIQKWMERNARAGNRYFEFLQGHFSIGGSLDARLQRGEYIGGTKSPIIVSEVVQNSESTVTSPQGNLAGHGITASNSYTGKYRVQEYGLILTMMSIMPRSMYQDGINRQWLRRTKFDFYFPEFMNLSEQAIENVEICAIDGNTTDNQAIFGYQGRYDEMRTKDNMVCAAMRTTAATSFDYWHLARSFDPLNPPELNSSFLECIPRKDIFAAPSEPGLIVAVSNVIKAIRPLPIQAEPGLTDHH